MMAFFNKPLRYAEVCFHGNCLYANPLLSQGDEKCWRSMASVPAEVTPDTETSGKCGRWDIRKGHRHRKRRKSNPGVPAEARQGGTFAMKMSTKILFNAIFWIKQNSW